MAAVLGNVDGRTATANDRLAAANEKLTAVTDKLTETDAEISKLGSSVNELKGRPVPACPACVCNQPARAVSAKPQGSPTPAPASTPAIAGKIEGTTRP